MRIDLRDYFAAHVAAAFATQLRGPREIAARAYDLADALLVERAERETAELDLAFVEGRPSAPSGVEPWLDLYGDLLENPPPPSDACPEAESDDPLADRVFAYDHPEHWGGGATWGGALSSDLPASQRPGLVRPGLVRTSPEADAEAASSKKMSG